MIFSHIKTKGSLVRVFLGVAGTVAGSLLCCGVGTVHCLFNLLYDII